MGTTFLVDDTSPLVTYSGNDAWTENPNSFSTISNDYNSTVHWATAAGATITYKFNGTGITVYGTVDRPGVYGLPGSSYTLDDNLPVPINSTGDVPYPDQNVTFSHIPFFSATSLSSREHTLQIAVTDATNSKKYIFDYFAIDNTVDASSSNAIATAASQFAGNGEVTVMIDDANSRIVYRVDDDRREWTTTDHPSAVRRTAHVPPPPLTTADGTAIFFFKGTSVEVFGTVTYADANVTPSSPVVKLSLYKGSSTSQQGATVPFTPSPAAQYSVRQRMHVSLGSFHSLSGAQYRLHVENANLNEGVDWDLDYVVYTPIYPHSNPGEVIITTTNSNGIAVPVFTNTLSHSESSSNTTPGSSKPVSKAAVAGGVIGALATIGLLIFLFWFYKKRRQTRYSDNSSNPPKPKWAPPFVIKRRDTTARAYDHGGHHVASWDGSPGSDNGGERTGQRIGFVTAGVEAQHEQPRWLRSSSVGGDGAVMPLTPIGRYRESRKTRVSARRTQEIPIDEGEILVIGPQSNQAARTPAIFPHRGHSGMYADEKQALGLPSPPPLGGGAVQIPYTIPSVYFDSSSSPPPTGNSDPMATSTTLNTATTTTNNSNSTSVQPRSSASDSGGRVSHTGSSSGRGRSSMSQSGQSQSGQSRTRRRRRRPSRPLQETDGGVQLDTWENYARGPSSTGRSDIDSGSEEYEDSEVMSGTLPPPYPFAQNP